MLGPARHRGGILSPLPLSLPPAAVSWLFSPPRRGSAHRWRGGARRRRAGRGGGGRGGDRGGGCGSKQDWPTGGRCAMEETGGVGKESAGGEGFNPRIPRCSNWHLVFFNASPLSLQQGVRQLDDRERGLLNSLVQKQELKERNGS
ncbi:hypothetical protein U9M48_019789 [Paspalum notatum var. saurae]|uniref:Uncharacterized protein n=1 Tax=Paspalum notatum var. saurae TaxID=547442 RepID=A0AAQ3WRV3_PASNO